MSEPFLSEIKIVSFNFPPKGWALCNGQFLPINQNQALFSLLGTTYGGNGQTTFALPDLRGQVPIHVSNSHSLGEKAGTTAVTISQSSMPTHIHQAQASSTPHTANPENYAPIAANSLFGVVNNLYGAPANLTALLPSTLSNVGGSQPHENKQPYLVLNFIIALQGIFPSQN
jgi:microcystin-dependent protein